MRWYALASLLLLAGCASGKILGDEPGGSPKATFVAGGDGQPFYLYPLHSKSPVSTKVDTKGLWVEEGWFQLEYRCSSPKNKPGAVDAPESNDSEAIRIVGGHSYRLECDPDVVGKVNLTPDETDVGSNPDGCAVTRHGGDVKGYDLQCIFPHSKDQAEVRAYMEKRAAGLCKGQPGHTITAYSVGTIVSGCSDAEFWDVSTTVECH